MKHIYLYREINFETGEMSDFHAVARDSKRAITKALENCPTVGQWYTEFEPLPLDETKARLIVDAIADDTAKTYPYFVVYLVLTDTGFDALSVTIEATSARAATETVSERGYVIATLSTKKQADVFLALNPSSTDKDA